MAGTCRPCRYTGRGVVHSESRSLSFNHECPAWASTGRFTEILVFQGFLQQLRQIAGRMSSGPRGAGLGLKLLIGAGALAYTVKEATYTGNPQSLWKHEYSAQLGLWSLTLSLSWSNLSYLVWQFFRDLLSKRVCGTGSKLDSVLHWYKTRDCLQLLCKFPALIKEKWSWAAVVTQPDTDGGWCKFCV